MGLQRIKHLCQPAEECPLAHRNLPFPFDPSIALTAHKPKEPIPDVI